MCRHVLTVTEPATTSRIDHNSPLGAISIQKRNIQPRQIYILTPGPNFP